VLLEFKPLHAQANRPPKIAEITTKEQDGYNKEYLPLVTKVITDAGGKFIVRGGKGSTGNYSNRLLI